MKKNTFLIRFNQVISQFWSLIKLLSKRQNIVLFGLIGRQIKFLPLLRDEFGFQNGSSIHRKGGSGHFSSQNFL